MQLHQYKGAISYGGSVVGGFRVDGAQAFCFQPSIKRLTSAKYKEPTSYDNAAKFLIDDEEKKTLKRAERSGTVATHDSSIELLIKRGYIERKDNKLFFTQVGRDLIQMMPDDYLLAKVHVTAYLESLLSEVEAAGKMTKEDFYMELKHFVNKTCSAIKNNVKTITVEREVIATCKQCGKSILENS